MSIVEHGTVNNVSTQKQQMKTSKFQLIKAKPITLNTEHQKRKI
jgi:hypothetical protein